MRAGWIKIVLVAVLLTSLASAVAATVFLAGLVENGDEDLPSDGIDSGNAMHAIFMDGEKYYPRLGVRNYLIMGIDKSQDADTRGQSDFLMIFSLDLNAETYNIVYVNRDTMVEVDYYDLKGNKGGTRVEQLALSHAYGDPFITSNRQKCDNTELSVSRLFRGMKFDGYISMTTDIIEVMVDHVGGVEVLVEDDLTSVDPRLIKGERVMLDGALAFKFVRARGGLDDSTNPARMKRHEAFMKAFLEKLGDESLTSSSVDFYEEISPMLVSNMDEAGQAELADRIFAYEGQGSISIEGEYKMGTKFWEFYAYEESIEKILKEVFYEKAN